MTATLNCSDVIKERSSHRVLDEISLTVDRGMRLALLGHNGAGKSTLIKTILGLTEIEGGEITVCGHAPGSRAARAAVAYLPESVSFHGALTGREILGLFASLAGEPQAEDHRRGTGADGQLHAVRRRVGDSPQQSDFPPCHNGTKIRIGRPGLAA